MIPYYSDPAGIEVYLGDCRDVLPTLEAVDHVITDPPFSERTHAGHDASARGHHGQGHDGSARKALGYEAWTDDDVRCFTKLAVRGSTGWIVCMTDHVLAPTYCAALEAAGRYVFAPIPYYAPGSTVRLSGDGPCSWTTWLVVARTSALVRWGTLPGGYTAGPGWLGTARMGGKPLPLMSAVIEDYSRPGETILDPFCGSGTTGVAAKMLGRKAILIELEEKWAKVTVERLKATTTPLPGLYAAHTAIQEAMPL